MIYQQFQTLAIESIYIILRQIKIKHTHPIFCATAFMINIMQDVANMLTRLFERDINITINRKIIQFNQFYLKNFFNIFVKRIRVLVVVVFVKIELNKKSVKGFLVILTIKLIKKKKLTKIDKTILNNCFEIKSADIEVLQKLFANLNI